MVKKIPDRRNGYYFLNIEGKPYKLPSVTTVLQVLSKPALLYWSAQQSARIALDNPSLSEKEVIAELYSKRDKAGERGKTIHSLAEEYAKGSPINLETVPNKYKGYAMALKSCLDEIQPKILMTEQKVYSLVYGYAGTLDGIWEVKDETFLIDFKTSKGIYSESGLQMSAYEKATLEMKLVDRVDKKKIVHLKDDGSYSLIEMNEPFNIFLNCLAIWRWKNEKD